MIRPYNPRCIMVLVCRQLPDSRLQIVAESGTCMHMTFVSDRGIFYHNATQLSPEHHQHCMRPGWTVLWYLPCPASVATAFASPVNCLTQPVQNYSY
jgi:hypothetical protein